MEKNLTNGSVFKTILSFSLPFLLSYFLQTLYGMADLFIIGQYNGVASTTAVSIGSQVMHMITVMIVGLAMGSTVMIGKAVGVGPPQRAAAALTLGPSTTLFMGVSVTLTVILLLLVRSIVAVMSTPEEAVQGTILYLTICFIGIPFITAYNIISSIFRGMGDSRSPMCFVAVACVANIILDYLFIGGLELGPAGAALGTTISQTISVIVSLCIIRKRQSGIVMKKSYFRPKKLIMEQLLKIGIPVALQDGLVQISFLVIIGFLFRVPSARLSTVSALAAQNIGAGKHDRAKKTLWYAITMCVSFGLVTVVVMQFAAGWFVGLFATDTEVIRLGSEYMHGYVWDCVFAGIHFCFSGYFCAYGRSSFSFLHNSISIVCARVPLAYLASRYFPNTLLPMGLATATGSLVSVVICVVVYLWMQRNENLT